MAPTESSFDEADSLFDQHISDDADLDPEDFYFADKSIEEHMVDLQHLITSACEQSGKLSPGINPQHHMDPLAQLRDECDAMREEVMETIKAKQEIQLELLQNVEKLQARIVHQREEKSMLQSRLIDAQQVIGQREEEREKLEQELLNKICTERSAKEELETQMADELKNRQELLQHLNKQIQYDWESHLELIQQLHNKSETQGQVVTELHLAREKCIRHNEQVLQSTLCDTDTDASNRPYTPTVYTSAVLQQAERLEELEVELQLWQDRSDQEQRDCQERKEEQDGHLKDCFENLREHEHFLEVLQCSHALLQEHIEDRDQVLEEPVHTLPDGTHPAQQKELQEAINMVRKLQDDARHIQGQEDELTRLQNLCREREQQEIDAVGEAERRYENFLEERRNSAAKKDELEANLRYLQRESAAEDDLRRKKMKEQEKKTKLRQLKADNDMLLQDLEEVQEAKRKSWCFRPKASSSSSSKQPSQAGMSQRERSRGKRRAQGESKEASEQKQTNPGEEVAPPIASAEDLDTGRSSHEDVKWKEELSFCVCQVGEERWLEPGQWAGLRTLEAENADGEKMTSRREAVDYLNDVRTRATDTHYLVKEGNLWWCIFVKGRRDLATKRMRPYIVEGAGDLVEGAGDLKEEQSVLPSEGDDQSNPSRALFTREQVPNESRTLKGKSVPEEDIDMDAQDRDEYDNDRF